MRRMADYFFGMRSGIRCVLCAGVLLGTMLVSPIHAETMDTRLSRIERDIDTLSRSVYKGEKPGHALASGVAAAQEIQNQFEARISQIEQDLRDLTNKSEEQGNAVTQVNRAMTDMVKRLSTLEQKQNGSAVAPLSGSVTSSGPTPVASMAPSLNGTAPIVSTGVNTPLPILADPNGAAPMTSPTVQTMGTLETSPSNTEPSVSTTDPTFMYENALELLKQRDYPLAEKSLIDFLAQNPNHTLTPNAKYWLGESYFVQNKFDAAARVFAEGYQKYPKGAKAADNLLKLGLSLAATNKTPDACVALKQISKDFPNGATAVKVRAESEIKKLKCS